jgi:ribosome biogenesis protein SSF1/2
LGRNNRKGEQRSVSLEEIGPRIELRLLKVSEGMPGREGAVIWHRFGEYALNTTLCTEATDFHPPPLVKKTAAEIKALKIEHAERARIRKQRREEQEANVARKKASNEKESAQEEEKEDGGQREVEEDEEDWDENDEVGESDTYSDSGEENSDSESDKPMPPPKRVAKSK